MSADKLLATTLSTKGQVILPKAVRDRRGWSSGDRLVVEERPDGVLLRREQRRSPTRLEDVAGMLQHLYKGPPLTVEQMDEGLAEAFRREGEAITLSGEDDGHG